jgi:hypothetical protein
MFVVVPANEDREFEPVSRGSPLISPKNTTTMQLSPW